MLHPQCHGGSLELTSNRQFESFNVGPCDGRANNLVTQRLRALFFIGAAGYDVPIYGTRQRYPSTMYLFVSSAHQPKDPASLTFRRRREWT